MDIYIYIYIYQDIYGYTYCQSREWCFNISYQEHYKTSQVN